MMKKPISAVESFQTWGRSSKHYENCKEIDDYIAHLESVIKSATLTDEQIEIKYPSYLQKFHDARNNRMRRESAKWARDEIQKRLKA